MEIVIKLLRFNLLRIAQNYPIVGPDKIIKFGWSAWFYHQISWVKLLTSALNLKTSEEKITSYVRNFIELTDGDEKQFSSSFRDVRVKK